MNRRSFLKTLAGVGVAAAAPVALTSPPKLYGTAARLVAEFKRTCAISEQRVLNNGFSRVMTSAAFRKIVEPGLSKAFDDHYNGAPDV